MSTISEVPSWEDPVGYTAANYKMGRIVRLPPYHIVERRLGAYSSTPAGVFNHAAIIVGHGKSNPDRQTFLLHLITSKCPRRHSNEHESSYAAREKSLRLCKMFQHECASPSCTGYHLTGPHCFAHDHNEQSWVIAKDTHELPVDIMSRWTTKDGYETSGLSSIALSHLIERYPIPARYLISANETTGPTTNDWRRKSIDSVTSSSDEDLCNDSRTTNDWRRKSINSTSSSDSEELCSDSRNTNSSSAKYIVKTASPWTSSTRAANALRNSSPRGYDAYNASKPLTLFKSASDTSTSWRQSTCRPQTIMSWRSALTRS